jgi:hypothetical protein
MQWKKFVLYENEASDGSVSNNNNVAVIIAMIMTIIGYALSAAQSL